ncbi:alpha/beta-hydrolase [Plenodomus tracheiphilus IPT5]|uniref:Alpha/beta-hydrolase n=1 Tax=Plenodomus tracheiphilus IPT5 TaxID=1408161 RepID=A0A6A7BK64_9PLEO|nr:alpha/beta-hydrolase [Plenodomus tracheiphilus IPT5]
MIPLPNIIVGLASLTTTLAFSPSYPNLLVRNTGEPAGQIKNISGIQIYHSYPPNYTPATPAKTLIHITDIYGLPLLENRLLADSLASNGYLVLLPDLFAGDAISDAEREAGLNLTEWRALHPPEAIDAVIKTTLGYVRGELGAERVGALGYCFGGKYVPRWLNGKGDGGVDVGFIAHPSFLTEGELGGVVGGLSIAAGTLDTAFNATAKARAESILSSKNVTFQSTLYAQAPHGFAVRVNQSIPAQAYAKQASFVQAVTWFDAWL